MDGSEGQGCGWLRDGLISKVSGKLSMTRARRQALRLSVRGPMFTEQRAGFWILSGLDTVWMVKDPWQFKEMWIWNFWIPKSGPVMLVLAHVLWLSHSPNHHRTPRSLPLIPAKSKGLWQVILDIENDDCLPGQYADSPWSFDQLYEEERFEFYEVFKSTKGRDFLLINPAPSSSFLVYVFTWWHLWRDWSCRAADSNFTMFLFIADQLSDLGF